MTLTLLWVTCSISVIQTWKDWRTFMYIYINRNFSNLLVYMYDIVLLRMLCVHVILACMCRRHFSHTSTCNIRKNAAYGVIHFFIFNVYFFTISYNNFVLMFSGYHTTSIKRLIIIITPMLLLSGLVLKSNRAILALILDKHVDMVWMFSRVNFSSFSHND